MTKSLNKLVEEIRNRVLQDTDELGQLIGRTGSKKRLSPKTIRDLLTDHEQEATFHRGRQDGKRVTRERES